MSLEIKSLHKGAIREIFNLIAKEGKIDRKGIIELFKMINYKLTEDQMNETFQKLFSKKEQINFEEFMVIFNLKMNDYKPVDVQNAFRLIAKEDDKYIPLAKIMKILQKQGMTEVEIQFLIRQLEPFSDNLGKINYPEFLKSLSIY